MPILGNDSSGKEAKPISQYKIRVYHRLLGGHVHIRIFSGRPWGTLGKSGEIVLTDKEFAAWKDGSIDLEFIEEAP